MENDETCGGRSKLRGTNIYIFINGEYINDIIEQRGTFLSFLLERSSDDSIEGSLSSRSRFFDSLHRTESDSTPSDSSTSSSAVLFLFFTKIIKINTEGKMIQIMYNRIIGKVGYGR